MTTSINGQSRIQGTRITIFDILTYREAGWNISSIAGVLGISTEQVESALDYVAKNEETVMETFRSIEERIRRGNPPEIEAKRAQSKQRFEERLQKVTQRKRGA